MVSPFRQELVIMELKAYRHDIVDVGGCVCVCVCTHTHMYMYISVPFLEINQHYSHVLKLYYVHVQCHAL